jgi:signal transduction histidine kinase
MKTELATGNLQLANEIADDLKDNETKILHHGKRADAIVKGMLQHTRTSAGQKELTDINALADEYLRLSYHGMRAKDKNFNATLKTDFDPALSSAEGKINIVPQDIGRVLLNLYNNAFYAVSEKSKNPEGFGNPQGLHPYVPQVTVVTKKLDTKILISVSDNGPGIPPNIVDKIFQPFFTTKPTGEGTGLGLSLSYDIIKAHGGEIRAETKEARPDDPVGRGVGTEFTIQLPIA